MLTRAGLIGAEFVSGAERGVTLSGTDAVKWLRARGWIAAAGATQVIADTFAAGAVRSSRIWLSPGQYVLRPNEAPRTGEVTVILLVEGTVDVELDGCLAAFPPGSLLLVSSRSRAVLRSETNIALYSVVTQSTRIGLREHAIADTSGPHPGVSDYWLALTSVLNQILGSSIDPDDLGARTLGAAVDNLLLAALQESTAFDAHARDVDTLRHLRTARAIIRAEAKSLDFTVGKLSDIANISRGHLHRVFAAANSTPLGEIRRERTRIARELFADSTSLRGAALLEIARRSGFRTVGAMTRAMHAFSEESDIGTLR